MEFTRTVIYIITAILVSSGVITYSCLRAAGTADNKSMKTRKKEGGFLK